MGREYDDHLHRALRLTNAGIKAAKDSPRRLDAAMMAEPMSPL
jgi:hypothetical protein